MGRNIVADFWEAGAKEIRIPRSKTHDLRQIENCHRVVAGADIVVHAAGTVGGIGFNQNYPGSLFYDNLLMGINTMEAARLENVKKFVAIGTICAYPKHTPTPFREDDIWNGYPEETNAAYGLAKKMLLVQAQAYRQQFDFNAIYLLPVNLYGPGEHFETGRSHVIPSLIRKFVEAKEKNLPEVKVWGTGKPTREFLFVEDAAEAIVMATEKYNKPEPVNIGSGQEISIKNLASLIQSTIGYQGVISWEAEKPDGQQKRRLDVTRAQNEFGFTASTNFEEGLKETIRWYLNNRKSTRRQGS